MIKKKKSKEKKGNSKKKNINKKKIASIFDSKALVDLFYSHMRFTT